MYIQERKGFTLIEVLTVVLIGALVVLFAIPNYRKSQDKNRYLTASGVLMELGNGVNIVREDFPGVDLTSGSVTRGAVFYSGTSPSFEVGSGESVTGTTVISWLVYNNYLTSFPIDNSGQYLGYRFAISTTGAANCSCNTGEAVACMTGSNANSSYTCAWVDKSGILHHN
ncbi:MAG: type II secretion system protein [Elusimicrobiaceae bacterium]|nr:type II secretion system protein [Elusimicrobiaceae bacterium]